MSRLFGALHCSRGERDAAAEVCGVPDRARVSLAIKERSFLPPVILCAIEGINEMLPYACGDSTVDRLGIQAVGDLI